LTRATAANFHPAKKKQPRPMSDQVLFSQWARGESPSQNGCNNNNNRNATQDAIKVKYFLKRKHRQKFPGLAWK
jgi:hypothetical protein